MKFKLSLSYISKMVKNEVYYRGFEYFAKNKILKVFYDVEENTFNSLIQGENKYRTSVSFDNDYELKDIDCECMAFLNNGTEPCKHIIALLIYIHSADNKGKYDYINQKPKIDSDRFINIFNYFYIKGSSDKHEIELVPQIRLSRNSYKTSIHLSLKIGINKLYVVKNIAELIDAKKKLNELKYGANFTFEPVKHTFSKKSENLLKLIEYQIEAMNLYGEYRGKDKRLLSLSEGLLYSILELYTDNSIEMQEFDDDMITMKVKMGLPKLKSNLELDEKNIIVNFDIPDDLYTIDSNFRIIILDRTVYLLSEEEACSLAPIMIYRNETKSCVLTIDKNKIDDFSQKVLPQLEKATIIEKSESFDESILKTEPIAEIYMDMEKNIYTFKIIFKYDNVTVDPFEREPVIKEKGDNRVIVRNYMFENNIFSYFPNNILALYNKCLTLNGYERFFWILETQLDSIKDRAKIYYSERLSNVKIRKNVSYSGSVSYLEKEELLEFSFNIDGIEKNELAKFIRAYKEKKKFYKLRDGSFINLKSNNVEKIVDFLDSIDYSSSKKTENLLIPKNKAIYIDKTLRDNHASTIHRNNEFKSLVQNILEPIDMNFEVPKELINVLRPYQLFGYKWLSTLNSYGLGGILADDMGLGKTLQILTMLKSIKDSKNKVLALIVVPTSLVFNWQAEIDKFAPNLKTAMVIGTKETRNSIINDYEKFDLLITSYPLIRRDIDEYMDLNFDFCILDEAQQIKNPQSQNSECCKKINAKQKYALTGTPIENNLIELWSIFDFIMPGYLFSKNKFTQRYMSKSKEDVSINAVDDLKRHINPFILRRLKKQVLDELPDKIENTVISDMTDEQKKIYYAYHTSIKNSIDKQIEQNGYEKSQIHILAGLTKLRQICCHPSLFIDNYSDDSGKLIQFIEIVKDAIESEHRILVFSQFTSMLDIIGETLAKNEVTYFRLDGSMKIEKRNEIVKKFNRGENSVFLISLKAGGTGLNLTSADVVIHYDPWWNPAVEEQATDRVYRIGQNKAVQVFKMVSKGTIEEKIIKLQEKKKQLINSVIEPGETLLSKLSKEDLEELFTL